MRNCNREIITPAQPESRLEPDAVHAKEVAYKDRIIKAQAEELAAWRDAFPEQKYHPKAKCFSVNGIQEYIG